MQQLAHELGVTRAAAQQWKLEGRRTPAEHCPSIERLCHGVVRCEELNDRVDWAFIRASGSLPASDIALSAGADDTHKPHPEAARVAA